MPTHTQIVREVAADIVRSLPAEGLINVRHALRDRFETLGFGLHSDELAEDWKQKLSKEIEVALAEWDRLGVPRPLVTCDSPYTLITYRHENYYRLVGEHSLPLHFGETLELLSSLSAREFLLVPILLLYLSGCDPILVTDAPNDGGVDCMGRIALGPLHSVCIFVQSKTALSRVPINTVMLDHKKFARIRGKTLYKNYIDALGTGNSSDGLASIYYFVTNNEFEGPSRVYARDEEIIIRSIRQIAFIISKALPVAKLHELQSLIGAPAKKLDYNMAVLLRNQLNS